MINYHNLKKVHENIQQFSPKTKLIIVSKTRKTEDIKKLITQQNFIFGENRVQEAQDKFASHLERSKIELHLIGPLQTNKVPLALNIFDTIQTIDRQKLVDAIAAHILKKNKNIITKNFFIQVNIGDEIQKSGVEIKNFHALYNYCNLKNLKISGIMCIPPQNKDPNIYFQKMVSIKSNYPHLKISMGMSSDYSEALKYKTDYIRVGSYIFD